MALPMRMREHKLSGQGSPAVDDGLNPHLFDGEAADL